VRCKIAAQGTRNCVTPLPLCVLLWSSDPMWLIWWSQCCIHRGFGQHGWIRTLQEMRMASATSERRLADQILPMANCRSCAHSPLTTATVGPFRLCITRICPASASAWLAHQPHICSPRGPSCWLSFCPEVRTDLLSCSSMNIGAFLLLLLILISCLFLSHLCI
jgi:hypothetical protein